MKPVRILGILLLTLLAPSVRAEDRSCTEVCRFNVESEWQIDHRQATQDALTYAQTRIQRHLEVLQPPVRTSPTLEWVRTCIISTLPEKETPTSINTRHRVILEIEMSPAHVRELRSSDRSRGLVKWIIAVWVGLLLWLSARWADDWTRNALTHWVYLASAVLFAIAVATLVNSR